MKKKDKLHGFYYENDHLFIKNYQGILLISKTKITLHEIVVMGKGLKIESMDGYLISISGNIVSIRMGDYYEQLQSNNDTR